jgi:hypothetical protein
MYLRLRARIYIDNVQNTVQKLAELCAEEDPFIWGYLNDADMKEEAMVTIVAAG